MKFRLFRETTLGTPNDAPWQKLGKEPVRDKPFGEVDVQQTGITIRGLLLTQLCRSWCKLGWYKITWFLIWWKFGDQSIVFHQRQDILFIQAAFNMLIKSMIDKLHSKNATVLEFKPAIVETRILRKKRLQYAIYKRLLNSTNMFSKCILSAVLIRADQRKRNDSRKERSSQDGQIDPYTSYVTVSMLSCFFIGPWEPY